MKISAAGLYRALEFALNDNRVINALGPIDEDSNHSSNSIIIKVIESENYLTFKILFDYKRITSGAVHNDLIVTVKFYTGLNRFEITNIQKQTSSN